MVSRPGHFKRRFVRSNSDAVILGLGAGYVVWVVGLFAIGEGLAAVFMTLPAWLLVGGFQILLTEILPESILAVTVLSGAGNLLGLLLSAVLNVAVIYALAHRIGRSSSGR